MRTEPLESLTAEQLENLTASELVGEANALFVRANKENTNLAGGHERKLLLHLQAQFYLTTAARKRADATAECDRRRNEEIAERDFRLERRVMYLIGAEIILSVIGLWAGYEQGKLLDKQTTALIHMDASTAATATAMNGAAGAQAASLHILQQEQAERSKKPRLALYFGGIPLDKASVRLKLRAGSSQTVAVQELLLKNEGDAPVSTFRLHILVPGDVIFNADPLVTVPEYEPSASPKSRGITLQLPLLPAGQTVRIDTEIYVLKGHPTFKIPFTVDALELGAVSSLGSLTVLPPAE